MQKSGTLKLRMIADFILVCAFGFVAPPLLAPISKSPNTMLAAFVIFLLSIGFLWDGLRTWQRLRKPRSG